MRIIICDDEQNHCMIIKKFCLSNLDENSESVIDIVHCGNELLSFCKKYNPDILFLDIELGDINGIEIAKYLRQSFPILIIVYITNHPNYVFSCFETEPLDFLRKPINKYDFDKTYYRCLKKYQDLHKSLPIKWQNNSVNLEIKDICFVEGYNRHLIFHLYNGDIYEVVGKLEDVFKALKSFDFIKTHQGFVVNMLHIKEFRENEIHMKNGETVLLSVRKRLKAKEAYSAYINRRF